MDTRTTPPQLDLFRHEFPDTPLYLGQLDEQRIMQATDVIISPGLDPACLPSLNTTKNRMTPLIYSDIALFAQAATAPIIAITGSNGKSTVTCLVGAMLSDAGYRVEVGGNLGRPALELLTAPTPDFYVLELSSFQLEMTDHLKPRVAAFLNLSDDHLDRHGTMANYQATKQRIYTQCQTAVWNRNEPTTRPAQACTSLINFGDDPAPTENDFGIITQASISWLARGQQRLLKTHDLKLQARHNWLNALAALAIGQAIQLPLESMQRTLQTFTGLPHRCEWVAEQQGVVWINDSKATNVGATIAALLGLGTPCPGRLILIAGGIGKGADFEPLRSPITQFAKAVILMGQAADLLQQALSDTVPLTRVPNLTSAIQQAHGIAQTGDIVLLSPACASQDMFKDYADRGNTFKQQVRTHLQTARVIRLDLEQSTGF